MEDDETPKLTKTEEKESFLKALEKRTEDLKATEERIAALVERNEELAARNLLGGRTDAGIQPAVKKEETDREYAQRMIEGRLTPEELAKA